VHVRGLRTHACNALRVSAFHASWTCNFAGCVLQSVNHIIICSTSSLHVVYPRMNALHVSLISIQNSPIFVWENVCCRYYSVSICPGNCENVCMTRIKSNNGRVLIQVEKTIVTMFSIHSWGGCASFALINFTSCILFRSSFSYSLEFSCTFVSVFEHEKTRRCYLL